MVTAIVVKLELGHTAKILDVPSLDGHTHEWVVFVKGAEGMVIENFVEKVVFWLHESYDPPKCVVRHPPYEVRQSGYAGFNILIDIHFKNKSEPKSVRFHYDMFLHMENMPPVNHTRVEMLTFTNPADDFKKRLLRAGGVIKPQEARSQSKEKKSHRKEARHEESRSNRPIKEKSDEQQKPIRSDAKLLKSHKKSEERKEKRRNSTGDGEVAKKRKPEKQNLSPYIPPSEQRSKDKDKPVKIKSKSEKSNQLSLFSREESIDIKQIKMKDPSKKTESRIESEKRSEIKVKKESKIKPEKLSKKKERQPSPELNKTKRPKEQITVKPRTKSSSESDSSFHRKPVYLPSDSDSDAPITLEKKRPKTEKVKLKQSMKKDKKSSRQSDNKVLPEKSVQRISAVASNEKVTPPPPKEHSSSHSSNGSRKSSNKTGDVNDKKLQRSNETKVTSAGLKVHIKDLKKRDSPKPKKEMQPSHTSGHISSKVKRSSKERKPSPIVRKPELKKLESSDSDSSEEGMVDVEADVFSDKQIIKHSDSAHSASSLSPGSPRVPRFTTQHLSDDDDVTNHLSDDSSKHHTEESDDENGVFESPREQHSDVAMETRDEEKFISESDQEGASNPESPTPLVTVDVGKTASLYPDLDDELFEFLQRLQQSLGSISDHRKVKEIASLIKKTGRYKSDGNEMCFDLCSLDRKTINAMYRSFVRPDL